MNAIKDILNTLSKFRVIIYFSLTDTEARYKRSVLGPFWLTFGTLIGVLGLGFVWSEVLNLNRQEFIPNLTVGLICWQFFAGCIGESPSVFIRNSSIVRNVPQPFFFYPMLLVSKYLMNFIHNFIIIIGVIIYYKVNVNIYTFIFIPMFLIILINFVFIALIFGLIGARYRDLEPTVLAVLPLLFFVTPILYKPSQLNLSSWITDLNPLAYYVSAIREPLMGIAPSAGLWGGLLFITLSVVLLGTILLNNKIKRISFWL